MNLVINACLSQSTKHSETRTTTAGEKMAWRRERVGREGREKVKERDLKAAGRKEKREEEEAEESSMRFRMAMMKRRKPSWKRSTMSAQPGSVSRRKTEREEGKRQRTGASQLEEVLLLELLEDAPLNLDELVRKEESEEGV